MEIKHKPATPLPWHDCYLNWVQPKDGGINTPQKNLPRDNKFALHATNAYPKLIAFALQVMNTQYDDGAGERLDAEALLRELGESL